MKPRGGWRPGAGRPPKTPGQRRASLSATLPDSLVARIRAYAERERLSVSEVVEGLLVAGAQCPPYAAHFAPDPKDRPAQPITERELVIPRSPGSASARGSEDEGASCSDRG